VFGRPPQILGGNAKQPHAGCEVPALNRLDPFINPETGVTERFVTLFLNHPDDPAEGCNNAYFLIRRKAGVYDWGEVESGLPAGENLRGTRTIEKSPFPDEPNTYYFGGYAAGPDVQPPRPNLAWIYKGVVGKREQGSVKTSPPAKAVPDAIYENAERGFSFKYPGDMVRAQARLLTMADNTKPPAILVDAVAAPTAREAVTQAFRSVYGTRELTDYTESNLYLGAATGVPRDVAPGGKVGKEFAFRCLPAKGATPLSVVGMAWTEGNHTMTIAVCCWGDYTKTMGRALLNKIIVSLAIKRTTSPVADRFKRLDRNGDGKLDAAEAGDNPIFRPADKNRDGVLALEELEAYMDGRTPYAPRPQSGKKP
jgi:hypothetical protein